MQYKSSIRRAALIKFTTFIYCLITSLDNFLYLLSEVDAQVYSSSKALSSNLIFMNYLFLQR